MSGVTIGAEHTHGIGQPAAAHPRHHHVGEHEIDRNLASLDQTNGVNSARRLEYRVAVAFQGHLRDVANAVFVFDEQHGLVARELGLLV
jgi:hypothetical protein